MERALLLIDPYDTRAADKLKKVLAFLGVAFHPLTVPELLAFADADNDQTRFSLLASSATFLKLSEELGKNAEASIGWQKNICSAFIFAGNDQGSFEKLARQITGNIAVSLAGINQGAIWHVSDQLPEFCKSMHGLRVTATSSALVLDAPKSNAVKIISTENGAAFLRTEFQSVPVFLSTADIIDLDAALQTRNFDIRQYFLAAVPVILYVKWAFAGICWEPAEIRACLTIDDPLLKPRYGFLNFQHLLNQMELVNFSTSIAFIPWNWNRSTQKIVRIFHENPKRFSLSIHGCNHVGGEFGSRASSRLAWKAKQAIQRMMRHQSKTGLAHDPVMIFPQGVFSETAMAVLKSSNFIGVVNSEVISTDPQPGRIKIADYWDVAVMNYSDFPIFTRRYPREGIENFAFDILLGKPCIIVVHHNDCHDDCRHVAEFIERLNKLNARLVWSNLAEVIRHSLRQRKISPSVAEVEMYGSEAWIENPSMEKIVFRLRKHEVAPATIKEIRVAAQPVKWTAAESHVAFEVELNPGEGKTVAFSFNESAEGEFVKINLLYKAKVMLRRYLCEVRDNYIMPILFLR